MPNQMTDKAATKLWLIDDDPALRLVLEDNFSSAGIEVISFTTAHGAWVKLNDVKSNRKKGKEDGNELPDVILTDIRMPMMDGLSFSDWVSTNFPELPIIIMTAHSDLQAAVNSYQTGAFEYLPKPFDLDEAVAVVLKAAKKNLATKPVNNVEKINAETDTITEQPQTTTEKTKDITAEPLAQKNAKPEIQANEIIGQSVAMQNVFRAIGKLSHTPITVLITGESGTGKELAAHALHETSPRKNKPLIALNMAAIPHDLIESELFGHEKGAFTGATAMRKGRFEQANGGTLFLDEIGDMPFSTQTRLLRVLANGEFFRVGGQKPIKVDVRIIAATHQNLEELVKQGKFREDLFYRLNVIRIPLPALRERTEDIEPLTHHFMKKSASELSSTLKNIDESVMQTMVDYPWPGNIRQLENACRWLTVMASGNNVLIDDLPPELLAWQNSKDTNLDENTKPVNNADLMHTSNTLNNHHEANTAPTNHSIQNMVTPSQNMSGDWANVLKTWVEGALKGGESHLLTDALPTFEKVMIDATLTHSKGHKGKASELLGWGRNTLTRKIQQLGLDEKW